MEIKNFLLKGTLTNRLLEEYGTENLNDSTITLIFNNYSYIPAAEGSPIKRVLTIATLETLWNYLIEDRCIEDPKELEEHGFQLRKILEG